MADDWDWLYYHVQISARAAHADGNDERGWAFHDVMVIMNNLKGSNRDNG